MIPVKGVSFTYTDYWFYVSETGIIDYKDMQFTVKNNQGEAREIVCRYQHIEGINVDLILDWERKTLEAGETALNNYRINVTGELSVIFTLEIYLHEKPVGSPDSQLTSGGIITNKVAFYSTSAGSLLTLRITDQAERPRVAQVTLRYSKNNSMPYSTIKEFNSSSYYGVLPYGRYRIQAYDLGKPSIYAEENFVLNDTEHNMTIKLNLVGFGRFKLEPRSVLGVNTTIFNHVGELESVKIYAQLYYDNDMEYIASTEPFIISPLSETRSQDITVWFGYIDWIPDTKYIVKGVIESSGILIAFKWSAKFDIPPQPSKPSVIGLETIIFVLGGVAFAGYFMYREIQIRKMKVELNEKTKS